MILTNKLHVKTPGESGKQIVGEIEEFIINFILPIVLLAGSVGLFVLYISPVRKEIPTLKSEVDSKTQEVQVLQAKITQLKVLQQNKDLVVSDLIKMSWALEERDKVPELTEQVRLMSTDSGVDFKFLKYTNTNRAESSILTVPSASLSADPDLYREERVNVEVDVQGFPAAIEFLKASETSIRLLKVDSLKISLLDQSSSLQLTMVSPYLNPAFSTYSQTAAPINLTDPSYRSFMERLDTFKNYAQVVDATLPKI